MIWTTKGTTEKLVLCMLTSQRNELFIQHKILSTHSFTNLIYCLWHDLKVPTRLNNCKWKILSTSLSYPQQTNNIGYNTELAHYNGRIASNLSYLKRLGTTSTCTPSTQIVVSVTLAYSESIRVFAFFRTILDSFCNLDFISGLFNMGNYIYLILSDHDANIQFSDLTITDCPLFLSTFFVVWPYP